MVGQSVFDFPGKQQRLMLTVTVQERQVAVRFASYEYILETDQDVGILDKCEACVKARRRAKMGKGSGEVLQDLPTSGTSW